MDQNDVDKVRVYRCPCGATSVRPLRGEPKPCPRCGLALDGAGFQVEDHLRFVERLIAGTEPPAAIP